MCDSWFIQMPNKTFAKCVEGFETSSLRDKRGQVLHVLFVTGLAVVQEAGGSPANIIRLLTFTYLGLTHTCRCFGPEITSVMTFDEDKIAEIQDEEKSLLDELDGLTAGFKSD
jgi:hypothetical protein